MDFGPPLPAESPKNRNGHKMLSHATRSLPGELPAPTFPCNGEGGRKPNLKMFLQEFVSSSAYFLSAVGIKIHEKCGVKNHEISGGECGPLLRA